VPFEDPALFNAGVEGMLQSLGIMENYGATEPGNPRENN